MSEDKQKITYEIAFAGRVYEVRCVPLSYHFVQYYLNAPTKTAEEAATLLRETVEAAEAECLIEKGIDGKPGLWSNDFTTLPHGVLRKWLEEMMTNAQLKAEITVKQEKN